MCIPLPSFIVRIINSILIWILEQYMKQLSGYQEAAAAEEEEFEHGHPAGASSSSSSSSTSASDHELNNAQQQQRTKAFLKEALLLKMKIITQFTDSDVLRVASQICEPPIRLQQGDVLQLDTSQVRLLLNAGAAIYSHEYARYKVGSRCSTESTYSYSCYVCSSNYDMNGSCCTRTTNATIARLHMHQRIDDCPVMEMIALDVNSGPQYPGIPPMLKASHSERFRIVQSIVGNLIGLRLVSCDGIRIRILTSEEEDVIRQLLHRLVELLDYADMGERHLQECLSKLEDTELLRFLIAQCMYVCNFMRCEDLRAELRSVAAYCANGWEDPQRREKERNLDEAYASEFSWRLLMPAMSEEELSLCFQGIADAMSLDRLIWILLIGFGAGIQPLINADNHTISSLGIRGFAVYSFPAVARELVLVSAMVSELKRTTRAFLEAELAGATTLCSILHNLVVSDMDIDRHNKEEFLQRANLKRPEALRLIDLDATTREGMVCLVDYEQAQQQQNQMDVSFSAISHTYGMDVYDIFDCECTTRWVSDLDNSSLRSSCRPSVQPRWKVGETCPHRDAIATSHLKQKRDKVVRDIMRMCHILHDAGVRYAWHDGVCIAQHDKEEVKATISRIGWVYAYASETIIFLHAVGKPIAILGQPDATRGIWARDHLKPRWHTRAWTFQEAVLSPKRRYCVRIPLPNVIAECRSLEAFEQMVEQWYNDNSSSVQVVEEHVVCCMLEQAGVKICTLAEAWIEENHSDVDDNHSDDEMSHINPQVYRYLMGIKVRRWLHDFDDVGTSFVRYVHKFPTDRQSFKAMCDRESKHEGDRLNSILALCEVDGFVAEKDGDMETSTLEFFKRHKNLGSGLETALYAMNPYKLLDDVPGKKWTSWMCSLYGTVVFCDMEIPNDKRQMVYKVDSCAGSEQDKLQVEGDMVCIKVDFQRCQDASITSTSSSRQAAQEPNIGMPPPLQHLLWKTYKSLRDQYEEHFSRPLQVDLEVVNREGNSRVLEIAVKVLDKRLGASVTNVAPHESTVIDKLEEKRSIVMGLDHKRPESIRIDLESTAVIDKLEEDHAKQRSIVVGLEHKRPTSIRIDLESTVIDKLEEDHARKRPIVIGLQLKKPESINFESVWPSDQRCDFGKMWSPYILKRRGFSAYLVWPRASVDEEEAVPKYTYPMLVVEGDPKATVEKIGVFQPSLLFRACVKVLVKRHLSPVSSSSSSGTSTDDTLPPVFSINSLIIN